MRIERQAVLQKQRFSILGFPILWEDIGKPIIMAKGDKAPSSYINLAASAGTPTAVEPNPIKFRTIVRWRLRL